ncbi:MAG: ABC-F family ATP-binding cassette domain-containing protein [Planctomycetota bacterium]|jgi:ATP-binding cassette subfamily F protein 3
MKTLLQAHDLEKRYGGHIVLESVSVTLTDGRRVGVLGRNGAGKSTLCRILTGEEEPDDGKVIRSSDLRLAYLEQHDAWESGETVKDFLMRHTGAEDWRCGKVAGRFDLKNERFEGPVEALSGGFQTRVKIAAMLLRDPNFLILDEPTNFLDLSTLLLLQGFLADWPGGALIVSHDREFLRRTCEHTLEVDRGDITLFNGPVDAYLEWREEQDELARRTNAAVGAKKAQLKRFIDRFGAKNTKATQAKSKQKEMDRLELTAIDSGPKGVRIPVPSVEPKKGIAFEGEDLAIGYPDFRVAGGIRLHLDRGTRAAIVGDNGQGKTTLMRTLAGQLEPLAGKLKAGHNMRIGYYAQHVYQSLDERDTVRTHLEHAAELSVSQQRILDMAGCFLFSGDTVDKPIGVLSGGERARVCLAGLLLSKADALLLDEPTNHLDFETVEALGHALRKFEGTVLFISHDRTFTQLVATETVEIDNGNVRRLPGSYADYVAVLERRAQAVGGGGSRPSAKPSASSAASGREAYEERKRLRKERTKARTALEKAEKRLHAAEGEKSRLAKLIEASPADTDLYKSLHEAEREQAEAEIDWLAAQDRMEQLGEDEAQA